MAIAFIMSDATVTPNTLSYSDFLRFDERNSIIAYKFITNAPNVLITFLLLLTTLMFYLSQELEILFIHSIHINTVPFSQGHSTAPVESGQGGSCPSCSHASGAPGQL